MKNIVLPPGAFRLFLAIVVVMNHSTRVDFGYMAVFVFFILSGYWITKMWCEKYTTFQRPYVTFILSRYWRLLPVFLLANALAIGIYFALSGTWDMSLRAALSNIFILGFNSLVSNNPFYGARLGQAWSLDIEIQFYLIAPLVIWLLSRKKSLGYWIAAMAVAVTSFAVFFGKMAGANTLIPFFGFFFVGMLAAAADFRPSNRLVAVSSIAAFAIIAGLLLHPVLRHVIIGGAHPPPIWNRYNWPFCAGLALLLAPYALATVTRTSDARDRRLGELSYVVYLIHMPLLSIYVFYFGQLPWYERIPQLSVTLLAIAAVSIFVFRYFDEPIDRQRRRVIALMSVGNMGPKERASKISVIKA